MEPIQFFALLNKVITNQDGGGKITLEFGSDSIESILQLQRLNAKGDINLAVSMMPYTESEGDKG